MRLFFWHKAFMTDVQQKARHHRTTQYRTTQHRTIEFTILLCLSALLASPVTAKASVWYAGEFSADIIISDPRAPQNKARGTFYVGKDRFRAEGVHRGQHKVLIVQPLNRKVWMLFPKDKTYYAGPGEAPIPPKPDVERLPGDRDSPCQKDKALSCTRIGSETINGIKTEKWEINHQRPMPATEGSDTPPKHIKRKMTLWIDPARRIVLRQQPEKGPTMERLLVATENIKGRQTEKWAFVQSYQGQTQKYFQWVDTALRVPVREEEDGKILMELVNIQEKKQPASLFEIPSLFKEIQPPTRSQRQNQAQPGWRQPRPDTRQHIPPAQPRPLQYH